FVDVPPLPEASPRPRRFCLCVAPLAGLSVCSFIVIVFYSTGCAPLALYKNTGPTGQDNLIIILPPLPGDSHASPYPGSGEWLPLQLKRSISSIRVRPWFFWYVPAC